MSKRFFLIGASVCLLVANLAIGQTSGPNAFSSATVNARTTAATVTNLSGAEIAEKLAAAKRLLQSRTTSSGNEAPVSVNLAAFDPATSKFEIMSVTKDSFLTKGADFSMSTQSGKPVRLRIVRPNGVNTAVTVTDANGRSMLPLLVQYPIIRDGSFKENAYYTSAHPAIVSDAVVAGGHRYLAKMFAGALSDLQSSGVVIPADLVEIAKHLVIVEHTDHKRFRDEDRAAIYPEVLALYALNQGDTYRYSVSSAGAGGMIQMIPKTYAAIREHHPNVALQADFVRAMQDHSNALKAQLLYLNDTWNFLSQTDDVQQALRSGIATKTELLAAGYNSNPYRLPNYLASGGSNWRTLIPAETQMYLAIYESVDSHVEFETIETVPTTDVSVATLNPGQSIARQATSAVVSWVGQQVLNNAVALTRLIK